MDTLTLITQARQAGLVIYVEGEMLRVRGPSSAEALALAVLDRKPEVMALLSDGDVEVAWRAAAFRAAIPHRGPIWPPRIRQTPLTDTPGHCTMCGDQLTPDRAQSPWRRCSACVKALWIACNETREDVTSSAAAGGS